MVKLRDEYGELHAEPEPEAPHQSPNIIVQFISEEDGRSLPPAVNIPAKL